MAAFSAADAVHMHACGSPYSGFSGVQHIPDLYLPPLVLHMNELIKTNYMLEHFVYNTSQFVSANMCIQAKGSDCMKFSLHSQR